MTMRLQGQTTARSWRSELQRMLDREVQAATELIRREESLQVRPADLVNGLSFGPYGTSPVHGLHFETADDTATS